MRRHWSRHTASSATADPDGSAAPKSCAEHNVDQEIIMNLLTARRTTMAGIGVAVAGLAVIATLSTSAASFGGRPLSADLNGAAEVPGPGDPDGTGRAEIRVRAARGEVCHELTVKNITPATWAAIHFAPAGAVGPDV
jgi:hypothetical protein